MYLPFAGGTPQKRCFGLELSLQLSEGGHAYKQTHRAGQGYQESSNECRVAELHPWPVHESNRWNGLRLGRQ